MREERILSLMTMETRPTREPGECRIQILNNKDGMRCEGVPERNLAFLYLASTAEKSKSNSTELKTT